MTSRLTVLSAMACVAFTAGTATAQNIYVPNYGDGTVSVINPATNSVIATIDIPGDCTPDPTYDKGCVEGIALSADGSRAYVSLDGSSQVAEIDTAPPYTVTMIDVTPRFDTLVFRAPVSDRVYVTSFALDSTGNCGFDDGGDPDFGAYLDATSRISVIEGGVEIGTIPVFAGVWQMTFSPDGEFAYAVACDGGQWKKFVKIDLDLDGLPLGSVGHVDSVLEPLSAWYGTNISLSPGSDVALVTGFDGCVQAIDVVAMEEKGQVCGFTTSVGVRFNPDPLANRAYTVDFATGELAVLNTTDPAYPLLAAPKVPVTSPGLPVELRIAGTTAYVIAPQEWYGSLPSAVIAFDITSPDSPVQGCSITVGNGGFELAVQGTPGPWLCPPPPTSGAKKAHGAGHLAGNPRIHFEFHAQVDKQGRLKGNCVIHDETYRRGRAIKCVDVTEFTVSGNTVTIKGNALDGKVPTTYVITATDNAKPGKGQDLFSITTGSGYAAGLDTLKDGDVKIYKNTPPSDDDDDDDEDDD